MGKLKDINLLGNTLETNENTQILICSNESPKQIKISNFLKKQENDLNSISTLINEIQNGKQDKLPDISPEQNGMFLKVSNNGTWIVAEGIVN